MTMKKVSKVSKSGSEFGALKIPDEKSLLSIRQSAEKVARLLIQTHLLADKFFLADRYPYTPELSKEVRFVDDAGHSYVSIVLPSWECGEGKKNEGQLIICDMHFENGMDDLERVTEALLGNFSVTDYRGIVCELADFWKGIEADAKEAKSLMKSIKKPLENFSKALEKWL
jgi:hypothetical protein